MNAQDTLVRQCLAENLPTFDNGGVSSEVCAKVQQKVRFEVYNSTVITEEGTFEAVLESVESTNE